MMNQSFAIQVYQLLHDSSGEKTLWQRINPAADCDCVTVKVKGQRGGRKYNKTFILYFVLMFGVGLLLQFLYFPVMRS